VWNLAPFTEWQEHYAGSGVERRENGGSAPPTDDAAQRARDRRADPQWATAQEQAIQERLQKYIGISPDRIELECRTKCCRARLPKALYDEHERELQSSVGLGGGEDETSSLYGDDEAGMVAAPVCFRRTDGRDPDRGAEREALLSTIRPELASCARGLAHEVVISVELTLDESGAITKADTRSDPTGEPAAACVERAVVGAAAFAPASEVSRLPVNVTLPRDSGRSAASHGTARSFRPSRARSC
jgi:hypothetical protein